MKYPIYHTRCGEVIFYYATKPHVGEIARAEKTTLVSPKQPIPEPGDAVYCPFCERAVLENETSVTGPRDIG
jgi:hypothetical protein